MAKERAGREPDMTVKYVAEALNLHPETVRTMARSGDFPNAYKTGRGNQSNHIRIPRADVGAYRKKQPRANRQAENQFLTPPYYRVDDPWPEPLSRRRLDWYEALSKHVELCTEMCV
jgi:excisionase family DNA binding protein